MTQQPMMTDTRTLAQRRKRARPDAMFLHQAAADEIQDRMGMVNKSFSSIAIVTGFPEIWSSRFADSKTIADTDTLALEPAHHDLIIHAMGLHWANDPVGQLIQCRRALKPNGLLLSVSLGGQTLHELRACLGQAEAEITGGMSPRVLPMADLRDMGGLLQRAGLALPVADTLSQMVEYQDAIALMHDLRAMGEANAMTTRLRHLTRRKVMEKAAQLYKDTFATDQGRINATFEFVFLAGWAPDESQPKPLRPGSAKQRLADALGTQENKLTN